MDVTGSRGQVELECGRDVCLGELRWPMCMDVVDGVPMCHIYVAMW